MLNIEQTFTTDGKVNDYFFNNCKFIEKDIITLLSGDNQNNKVLCLILDESWPWYHMINIKSFPTDSKPMQPTDLYLSHPMINNGMNGMPMGGYSSTRAENEHIYCLYVIELKETFDDIRFSLIGVEPKIDIIKELLGDNIISIQEFRGK